VLILLT